MRRSASESYAIASGRNSETIARKCIMMTSSNEHIFRVTGNLCGEFTGHWRSSRTKASDAAQSFHVFFDLRLNKRLSKQSWGWWIEMPSLPLWRHCNDSLYSEVDTDTIPPDQNWGRQEKTHINRSRQNPDCYLINVSENLDGVIKWKHFPRYGPFVRRIHWSPVNSAH